MDDENLHMHQQCCEISTLKNVNEDEKYSDSTKELLKIRIPGFTTNVQHVVYPISTSLGNSYNSDDSHVPTIISSDSSETTLSITNINQIKKLPTLVPRDHGSNCVLEISILEKHKKGCPNKKTESENRHPLDDKTGSYDVINRVVYKTCTAKKLDNGESGLKNSAKGIKLNDPTHFGKDLKENRSRIEAIPILPESSSCSILRAQTDGRKPADSVSIYIRVNKNEEVPKGFQKMHYKGDSCKLHNPTERSKQILALQKIIDETSSAVNLSKTNKEFSPIVSETQVFSTDVPASSLPQTLFASNEMSNSNDSLEITEFKKVDTLNRFQQTDGTCPMGCEENVRLLGTNKETGRTSNLSIQGNQGLFKRFMKKRTRDESTENNVFASSSHLGKNVN